ncbi:MAG: putative MarR-family transcriptional regulator [Mycobacterium sp.]|nr:putative MarR-family transcriptional regulator [Mycobacterium sp.]
MEPEARQVMERLRTFAADYTELTRHLARWLGVHSADAAAFAEILYAEDMGRPLTPALLARRIGLSSGATSSLLNRLEAANLLTRSREHTDRRVVTLRSVPSVAAAADGFFDPMTRRVTAVFDQTPAEVIDEFATFLTRLHNSMTELIDNIDEEVAPRPSP